MYDQISTLIGLWLVLDVFIVTLLWPGRPREMKRYFTLGDGTKVSLWRYVKAWRTAKAAPAGTWFHKCPNGWGGTREAALSQFEEGLHDRINRHSPWYGRGRKWGDEYQRTMRRAAYGINTPRLIICWLPPDLKTRFAHRLRENCE